MVESLFCFNGIKTMLSFRSHRKAEVNKCVGYLKRKYVTTFSEWKTSK